VLKKVVVTAVTAGALSLPFAAVAGASPGSDNPGVPGNIGGISPGSAISDVAKLPGRTPDAFGPPGQTVKNFTPRHTKAPSPPPVDPTPPPTPVDPTPPSTPVDPTPVEPSPDQPAPPAPPEVPVPLPK
jgi:hypothetical protein